ncbi:unnamed protein product [Linum tenue]|uniref:Calmodulin-binding domain-containing protein n=1 Tax=Linum tenue TaxID=586396 RepID=A0AAV0LAI1_9ROSI|nr:unnamed protein product [Linum tenue]
MEQKAMERVISLGTSSSASTKRTRRGSILNVGNHHNNIDEQPRKLKFRPCRVIEFKPEITSPRRLKFKRRAPRNDSSWSKVYTNFGVLREGCVRREEINRRVAFADVVDYKKVVLRHQDMQADKVLLQASINNMIEEIVSKLVEDKKSKVKALVGAFESLNTLHDSKVIPTLTV